MYEVGKMIHPAWTVADIDLLRKIWPRGAEARLAFPNRNAGAIKSKARSLGLATRPAPWLEAEIATLVALHPDYKKIGSLLPNRSHVAIRTKAHELDLSSPNYWTKADLKRLRHLQFNGATVKDLLTAFPARSKSGIRLRLLKMGIPLTKRTFRTQVGALQDINERCQAFGIYKKYLIAMSGYRQKVFRNKDRSPHNMGIAQISNTEIVKIAGMLGGECYAEWED